MYACGSSILKDIYAKWILSIPLASFLTHLVELDLRPLLRHVDVLEERPVRAVRLLLHRRPELQQVLWHRLPGCFEDVD